MSKENIEVIQNLKNAIAVGRIDKRKALEGYNWETFSSEAKAAFAFAEVLQEKLALDEELSLKVALIYKAYGFSNLSATAQALGRPKAAKASGLDLSELL